MDPFRPPPEGPPQAGGDPAPGNVATTRLPEAGVREHPAPLGALRQELLVLEHKQDPGQGAPRIPLALLVRTGQGLLAGVGAPGRAGEGGVGGRFVHRVTFCAEGNEFRLFSAQSVTLCTKCSPRRPRRSSLSGGPSPAWSHKVASCGVVRVRGLVVGVGSEVSYQGRSPCRGACRLCRPVGVGAQGVCFRVELACRSCGVGGRRRWEVVVPAGGVGSCCTFILFPRPGLPGRPA